jgi:hypothetical protein
MCLLCLRTAADVEHQVDERRERGNSLDGSGAAGKAAFMLVREVSDSADMMILGRVGYY